MGRVYLGTGRGHRHLLGGFWGGGRVTCRTGAGAWGSRTSRFRQQRGERRKMPQTPLERRSGTEWQSRWLWEGSVAPTSQWTLCRRRWHDPESAPCAHKQAPAPQKAAAAAVWGFCAGNFCAGGSLGALGQFKGAWWFWVATGWGLKSQRVPPKHRPAALPVNHPWGARLPQRESRWGVSGGFGIHGASLGSPEPLAASPLPQGKRKRGRNEVFWGTRVTALPVRRRS